MLTHEAKVYTTDRKNPMIFKWDNVANAFIYRGKKHIYKIREDYNGYWIGRLFEKGDDVYYWVRIDDILKVIKIEFFFGEWTFRKWRNGKKKG